VTYRPPRKQKWDQKRDETFYQQAWQFNRVLVRICLIPAPFCIGYIMYWNFARLPGTPPMIVTAILLGSVAFTLALSFIFWRCPQCNQILFRGSAKGAGVLFWLADPDSCPDCGVVLRPRKKPRNS
jgi:hypothetical protein